MAVKPRIAIVGPGRLGSALALELRRARYRISEIVSGDSPASRRKARALAGKVQATWNEPGPHLDADVIWFCVPDREIARAARRLAEVVDWRGKMALHSSGALGQRRTAPVAGARGGGGFGTSVDDVCGGIGAFASGSAVRARRRPFRFAGGPPNRARPRRRGLFHFEETGKWPTTRGEHSLRPC